MLIIDSTGVGDPILEDLMDEGYDVIGMKFSNENKPNMVKLLAKDLEKAHAFVLDDEFVNSEFQAYTMTVTPGGRYTYSAPEGMHDDVVSAKMLQHHGLVNEGVGNVEMLTPSTADLGVDPSDDPDGDEYDAWDDLVDDEPLPEGPLTAEQVWNGAGQPTLAELLSKGFF
jgi:hypothetical protein